MPIGSLRRKWADGDVRIDPKDRHLLAEYAWTRGHYFSARTPKGKVYLHRLIAKAPKGVEVDHINGDRYDNRRSNLRLCTRAQNSAHWLRKRPGSNPCTGVFFLKGDGKWVAYITSNYKRRHLGRFGSLASAIKARNKAVREHFGEFGTLSRRVR